MQSIIGSISQQNSVIKQTPIYPIFFLKHQILVKTTPLAGGHCHVELLCNPLEARKAEALLQKGQRRYPLYKCLIQDFGYIHFVTQAVEAGLL